MLVLNLIVKCTQFYLWHCSVLKFYLSTNKIIFLWNLGNGEWGRVNDLWFFDYLSPFCFLLIEFHCTFVLSYKMLQYFVYYYYILIRMWSAVFLCLLCFFLYSRLSSYLLRLFLYLISFLLFPRVSVSENTLAWVPHFL